MHGSFVCNLDTALVARRKKNEIEVEDDGHPETSQTYRDGYAKHGMIEVFDAKSWQRFPSDSVGFHKLSTLLEQGALIARTQCTAFAARSKPKDATPDVNLVTTSGDGDCGNRDLRDAVGTAKFNEPDSSNTYETYRRLVLLKSGKFQIYFLICSS